MSNTPATWQGLVLRTARILWHVRTVDLARVLEMHPDSIRRIERSEIVPAYMAIRFLVGIGQTAKVTHPKAEARVER
jgi:ribosome-binding protein aMBF1 (putative translation factor)